MQNKLREYRGNSVNPYGKNDLTKILNMTLDYIVEITKETREKIVSTKTIKLNYRSKNKWIVRSS